MTAQLNSAYTSTLIKAFLAFFALLGFHSMNATAQQRSRPEHHFGGRGQTKHQPGPRMDRNLDRGRDFSFSRIGNERRRDNDFNRHNNRVQRPYYENQNRVGNRFNRPGNITTYNHPRYDHERARNYHLDYRGYKPYHSYGKLVYSPRNPSWRYAYAPRRQSVFYSLPSSYFSINFGGLGYRYYDGIFYRPYNNVFRVVAPPIGIFVNILPSGYSRIYVDDYPYYYYNGTFYDHRDNHYFVVSPPVGAVVESIPAGYETINMEGETYYVADGAQYKPVMQDNGEIWYEVIKANT